MKIVLPRPLRFDALRPTIHMESAMEHRPRVLVVEDEPLIAFLVEDIIESAGAQKFAEAESNAEALAVIARGGFDVAIVDCTLNDGDCETTASALAAADIPFIIVSGHPLCELKARFPDRPIVTKPFLSDALVTTLGSILRAPLSASSACRR